MPIDLKQTIRDRGLTQREVAQRLGLSEPTVSHWLAHYRDPRRGHRITAEAAVQLAAILQVDPHHLRPDIWKTPAPSPSQRDAADNSHAAPMRAEAA